MTYMKDDLQQLRMQKKINHLWEYNEQLEARIQELNLRLNTADRVLIQYGEDPALLYRKQLPAKPKQHFMDHIFYLFSSGK